MPLDDEQKTLPPCLRPSSAIFPDRCTTRTEAALQMLVADLDWLRLPGPQPWAASCVTVHAKDTLACTGESRPGPAPCAAKFRSTTAWCSWRRWNKPPPAKNIVVMAGIEDVTIGDTICTRENPRALPRIRVDESPRGHALWHQHLSSGRFESKIVQSRAIHDRLIKENPCATWPSAWKTRRTRTPFGHAGANFRWLSHRNHAPRRF